MKHPKGHRPAVSLVAAATLALLVSACGSSSSSGGSGSSGGKTAGLTHVNLALDWIPSPTDVGFFYALNKGYFQRAGLDVHWYVPSNTSAESKLVASGTADLAFSYEAQMYLDYEAGIPVVAVGAVMPQPVDALIVRPGVTVGGLSQLKGLTIGSTGLPFNTAFLDTALAHGGLTTSDVHVVNVNTSIVPALLSGKVAAILGGLVTNEAIEVGIQSGKTPTVFTAPQLGIPTYNGINVIASTDRLKNSATYRSTVRRFMAALNAGTVAAIQQPKAAMAALGHYEQGGSTYVDRTAAAVIQRLTPADAPTCMIPSQWNTFAEWMFHTKQLSKVAPLKDVLTTQYLPVKCAS